MVISANVIFTYRGILFSIGFPIIQLLAFHYSFGHDPKGLLIGVINHESNNCDFGKNRGSVTYVPNDFGNTCDFVDLSCRFLHDINDTTAKKVSNKKCTTIRKQDISSSTDIDI